MSRPALILFAISITLLPGCRSPQGSALSAAVEATLSGSTRASDAVWNDTKAFYQGRQGLPAWVADNGKVEQSSAILNALNSARDHGLTADYGATDIENAIASASKLQGSEAERAAAIADLDVRITAALLTLGRDVALGRSSPASIDPRWKRQRTPPDLVAALQASADDVESWLEHVQPVHPEYARLVQGNKALLGQQAKGGWPAVHARALAPGQTNPAVVTLRQRLVASGELSADAAASASPRYDDQLVAAVKRFQEHHTLKVSGTADAETIAAMNVPIEARIAQVGVNLERWRWMPDDFGPRHFLVNIPSYHVLAREEGKTVLDIRVVVGKPGHETPVFSGSMSTVVFSPYWNIPDTIAEGETVPALVKDPSYLAKNEIEVLRPTKSGPEVIDPAKVHWDDEGDTKDLMFRQKPGAKNALGHVKFLFPNPYDVYLHDTPADALFARTGRALSHGCVRVEQPEALAQYVLRGSREWTDDKILEAMNAGVEHAVKLPESIPVHIVYFTASVDENGGLHLLNDVYGYDARQLRSGSSGRG